MLKIVNPEADFLVCTDAYKEGLRGVLMQEGSVVCYESQKLNEHEANYVTHDLELARHSACLENVEALPPGKEIHTHDRPLWIATSV
jgi:hypothetical protein